VLAVEVNLQTCRVSKHDILSAKEYDKLMMDRIDEVPKNRFKALREIKKEKMKVAKAYNKRVREKLF
jgi:hypothetical protein